MEIFYEIKMKDLEVMNFYNVIFIIRDVKIFVIFNSRI